MDHRTQLDVYILSIAFNVPPSTYSTRTNYIYCTAIITCGQVAPRVSASVSDAHESALKEERIQDLAEGPDVLLSFCYVKRPEYCNIVKARCGCLARHAQACAGEVLKKGQMTTYLYLLHFCS